MQIQQNVPNSLRAHRQKAGLRQSDVAWSLGLGSTDRISRWENGLAVPHIPNLFRLAALYKTTPQELYAETWKAIETELRGSIPIGIQIPLVGKQNEKTEELPSSF